MDPRLGKCLEWQGNVNSKGYGTTKVRGVTLYVHRLMYAIAYGYVPATKFVCHRCDNRRCLRPKHLFLGTAKQNHADMVAKGRHWIKGKDPKELAIDATIQDILPAQEQQDGLASPKRRGDRGGGRKVRVRKGGKSRQQTSDKSAHGRSSAAWN